MKPLRRIDTATADPVDQMDLASVPRGPGRRLPATIAAIYLRDATLAEAALLFFSGASSNAAALELQKQMMRYREGAWRRHCTEENLPPQLVGKIEELFWHALKMRDIVPSQRTIRAGIDRRKKLLRSLFLANGRLQE